MLNGLARLTTRRWSSVLERRIRRLLEDRTRRYGNLLLTAVIHWPTPISVFQLTSLTNEGGILKSNELMAGDGREFQLVPEALWFALSRWYKGGSPALPRRVSVCGLTASLVLYLLLFQVVRDPETKRLELELYPIQVVLLRHQQTTATTGVLGGAQNRYQNSHAHYGGMPGITGSLVSGISAYTMSKWFFLPLRVSQRGVSFQTRPMLP